MTLLRRFALALVLTSICCCATPAQPHGIRLLARVLADACTPDATDDVLIDHAEMLLASCHYGAEACIRMAYVRLEDEGEPASPRNRIGIATCIIGADIGDCSQIYVGPSPAWVGQSIPAAGGSSNVDGAVPR